MQRAKLQTLIVTEDEYNWIMKKRESKISKRPYNNACGSCKYFPYAEANNKIWRTCIFAYKKGKNAGENRICYVALKKCCYWQKGDEEIIMKTSVTISLSRVLQIVFDEIAHCYYRVDQETKEEYVRVVLKPECRNKVVYFDVCVTADSVTALVDDVWKECKRRFA